MRVSTEFTIQRDGKSILLEVEAVGRSDPGGRDEPAADEWDEWSAVDESGLDWYDKLTPEEEATLFSELSLLLQERYIDDAADY